MLNSVLGTLNLQERFNRRTVFTLYCVVLGLILILESVMSYYFPIVLERSTGSNLTTGMVIGLANIAALAFDFIIPEAFKKKTWKFLFLAAVILQLGYPGCVQLGVAFQSFQLLVVAALFWNIYYEFMAFSRHNFIVSNEKKEDYSRDWGAISVVGSLAAIVGPIIGAQLVEDSIFSSSVILGVLEGLVFTGTIILLASTPNKIQEHKLSHHRHIKLNILKEFRLWEILGKRVLPVLLLGTMLSIIGAAVGVVGGIMGEELLGGSNLDWLLIFMFNVPGVFVSLFLARIQVPRFKKMISQISLILSGVSLLFLPFIKESPVAVIISFFMSSLFCSVAWIFNEAVYSDLTRRSGERRLYISSMERLNDSIGYLVGSVLIGYLADRFGYFVAFEIIGALCVFIAFVLIFVTPRKIIIPHQEMEQVELHG